MNLRMNESKFDRIAVWLLGGFEWFDGCGEAQISRFVTADAGSNGPQEFQSYF